MFVIVRTDKQTNERAYYYKQAKGCDGKYVPVFSPVHMRVFNYDYQVEEIFAFVLKHEEMFLSICSYEIQPIIIGKPQA